MIRRRRQLLVLSGLFAFGGRHAVAAVPPRVGVLNFGAAPGPAAPAEPITRHLGDLGYLEGTNIAFERRYANGVRQRYPELAAELLRADVDVIFTPGSDIARAFQGAGPAIPIVFVASDDPVTSGLVGSLARPGGMFTGVSLMSPELGGKRLELLKATLPGLRRMAVMYDRNHEFYLAAMRPPAAQMGIAITPLQFDDNRDFPATFAAAKLAGADAMFVAPNRFTLVYASSLAALSVEHRLPAISAYDTFARAGGLLSYGPRQDEAVQRAAAQIGKVLRGARPAEIPVEQISRFALVVNLKTARALGIRVPQTLLLRADEVIQ